MFTAKADLPTLSEQSYSYCISSIFLGLLRENLFFDVIVHNDLGAVFAILFSVFIYNSKAFINI